MARPNIPGQFNATVIRAYGLEYEHSAPCNLLFASFGVTRAFEA
jgi:hypothetical protein